MSEPKPKPPLAIDAAQVPVRSPAVFYIPRRFSRASPGARGGRSAMRSACAISAST